MFWKRGGPVNTPSHDNFLYLRIDDRLIHGQVVIGWGEGLKLNRLILINDHVATQPFEAELYRQIIPTYMQGNVLSLAQAARLSIELRQPGIRALVVVSAIEDGIHWVEQDNRPDLIILGGLRAARDRIRLLDYVHLTPGELASLRQMVEHGIAVICQDLPTSEAIPLEKAIHPKS